MARYERALGAGLILGLAAAALWGAGRRYAEVGVPRLMDWDKVRQTAYATSRKGGSDGTYADSSLGREYSEWVAESERLIGDYTGRELPGQLQDVRVVNRFEWIDANIANFRMMFQPVEDLYASMMDEKPFGIHLMGGLNQIMLSGQMGALVGYMAQRVLGQYDLSLLGREPITTGKLYFVEPNIAQLEKRLRLPGKQFRMWIALHETTHAYEFECHPWLREYMNNMLAAYFDSLSHDLLGMKGQQSTIRSFIGRIGGNFSRTRHALELVMSPEQRRIFRQQQALMSLVEGFSNHVMDAVGRTVLEGYDVLKERFEDRARHKSRAEVLFTRLTGMDVKMEQYRSGEQFVNTAVDLRGLDFVNKVWDSPLNLPTLAEIYSPADWVARMERVAAA
ncbi:MAG: zinc-dependent metalloprotease [Chloroflexota bacterium]